MNAGEVERHRLAGIFWRRAGHGIDLGAPFLSQSLGEIVLRFDQDAGPTKLFKGPGLRTIPWIVGANIDEIAAERTAEKL